MNTSLGYSKKTLTDSNVLLSGGGDKALSEFIGSLNWDSTNKKLQYKSASSTNFTDLITFGSNAFNSTSYLPLSGGTMVGTISAANDAYGGGGFHNGYANIILRGNTTTGTSGIVFSSSKGDTSVNRPSDCAFIQYQPYGVSAATAVGTNPTINTSGEAGRFVIGIYNDSGDQLWLQTREVNDLKHVVGANIYTILDSNNSSVSKSGETLTVKINGTSQSLTNTWTAWAGATDSANGTAGYMPAPTSALRGQFLRGDGTWVSLNNYSLPTASNSTLGGVKTGAAITDTTGYTAVAIKDGVIYYKDTNTTYSFSNLLFLLTSGTNLMTYNSQAVRTVLAGSNITFTHSNNVLTIAAKDTTYSTVSKTAAGLCPTLPNETTTTKYLRLDGAWVVPPDNNTWKAANSSQEGYVPKSTANKILRANADGALYWGDDANTTYTFYNLQFQNSGGTTVDTYKPTTSPTKTLKAGDNVTISAASNIITIASTNTWNAMTGATSSANGTVGYVNATPPKDGYNTKFLRADGTWSVPAYPTKSSWNYNDMYVASVSISGDNLRINKNGANTDLTIPYATNADLLDGQHGSYYATASSLAGYLLQNTADGIAYVKGEGQNWWFKIATINITKSHINRPIVFEISQREYEYSVVQIMFRNKSNEDPNLLSFKSNNAQVYYIRKTTTSTWEVYGKFNELYGNATLHRITGSGADIGVTVNMTVAGTSEPSDLIQCSYFGQAAYAASAGSVEWANVTSKPFNWSGQSGQPTWLWGSNDGTNYYVWNPLNFSVNYANSAGSISGYSFKTASSVTHTGWVNNATDDKILPTMSFMAYWNGRYSSSGSNLQYCDRGRFGTIVTAGSGDYWSLFTDSYACLRPGSSNGWIQIGTSNTSYGILPSTAGGAGNGHNYIGTSSWYWKYAYIDQIYGYLNGSCSGSAGSVAWGNVTSKPAASGNATTPVYWNGSGFTNCTAYGSASVNYANSAGVATGITNGFKRFEFNAGKAYIGWVSIASLQLNTSNQYDYNSFNLHICRSYNSPSSESYAINITIGWVKATVRLIGKSVGSQIINKCRIAIDATNHILYLQVYVNTAYTTYQNSCSATLVGIVNNDWTGVNTVNNSLTNVTELDLTAGIQADYSASAGNADTVDSQHFSWSNESNSPTYLWATNSNGTSFLCARGSMSVNYANSAGAVAWGNVSGKPTLLGAINYNNNSNSTYQVLWGSGNACYGTAGIYVNPYYNYVYATTFYTTSDRSKKQNISEFSEHIRKFQMKDTKTWHYGVIAQEVEEMFRDGEEGNMTVNYNSVLSYYVGQLENRVKELEEKIKVLETKLNKLI